MPAWLAAAIPGLISAGANVAGQIFGARDTRRHQIRMWEKQQEYNLPSNQMKRLSDAGINPHLAFGKGSISNVSTQQPQTAELKINPHLEQFAQYQQVQNLRAQNELIRAQAQKAYAEAEVAEGTVGANIRGRQLKTLMDEIKHTQQRFGVEKAEPMLKVLFQTMEKKTHAPPGEKPALSENEVRNIMSGIVVTQGVAKILTALGFGKLLGKLGKNKPK